MNKTASLWAPRPGFGKGFRIAFEYRFQKGSRPDDGVLSIDFVL